jgi:ribonuclease HI
MEMQAAIAALEFLQQHDYDDDIQLNTDSKYLIQGITQWMRGWKRKGWKTAAGKAVLNKDLWLTLDDLTQHLKTDQHVDVDWKYVKGHAGNVGNERCDEIARSFSQKRATRLKQSIGAASQTSSTAAKAKPAPKAAQKTNSPQQTEIPLPNIDTTLSDMSDTRINRVSNMLTLLQTADELAKQGYLITTSELIVLTGLSASELAKRGDDWTWRNWTVSCVSSESEQDKFWQLERIED